MKVLSLFDGISCGQIALERAGINVEKYYASEIDKYAISITQYNYPDTIQLGDVNNWREWDIDWNSIDLLIGGSPCTSFSNSGKRTGFNGASGLFYKYLEILDYLKVKNPNIKFLLENVKMKKEWENEISRCLNVQPVLINSALVSAQQRKRLYWCNWKIEQPIDKGILLKDIMESNKEIVLYNQFNQTTQKYKSKTLTTCSQQRTSKNGTVVFKPIRLGYFDNESQGNRVYSITGKSVCLSANGGGGGAKTGLYKIDLPDGDYIIRKLMPIEAERLQTLPDDYTKYGVSKKEISNTQRYKTIGNGWTVDVIAHIFKYLVR